MSFTYRGLKANFNRHTVTPAEVDQQLERLRQNRYQTVPVKDRTAQPGDLVILDYAGYCDGEAFEGGSAQKQSLVLGSGTFIPGFEEQLVGHKAGEAVTVYVQFPTQYHSAKMAGKEAEFHCQIHEVRERRYYEHNDIFAQQVGGCETYEEFRKKMADSMQKYADSRSEMELQDQLLTMAAETLEMEVSAEALKEAVDGQMQTLQSQLARQGLTMDMYCERQNTTREQLRKQAEPVAEAALRSQAAVNRIVELEGLKSSREDIDEACNVICRQNKLTMEQLKPYYDEEFEQALVQSVLTSKAMALIRDAAEVTTVTQ